MSKRVIVPLDRTEHSELALRALHDFCDEGDEVFLLSISEPAAPLQSGVRPGRILRGGITGPAGGGATYISRPDVPTYAETKDQAIQSQLDEMQDYLLGKVGELESWRKLDSRLKSRSKSVSTRLKQS